jgi:hypothetical protein
MDHSGKIYEFQTKDIVLKTFSTLALIDAKLTIILKHIGKDMSQEEKDKMKKDMFEQFELTLNDMFKENEINKSN